PARLPRRSRRRAPPAHRDVPANRLQDVRVLRAGAPCARTSRWRIGGMRMSVAPPPPPYPSHTYRGPDSAVNPRIWRLLHEAGLVFSVDPKSDALSIPYLEHMMARSSCFVAVATQRPEQARYRTSPFIVVEYGLAVQFSKPSLVFVENTVAGRIF